MDDENRNLAADNSKGTTKKRDPGKRCVVMFCNNTNADNVSLHQFPRAEPQRRQWIQFVLAKRDDDWTPGAGHICSNHFSPDSHEGMGAKLAGFASKLLLKKTAVPTIQVNPTPEQLEDARRLKRKLSHLETKQVEKSKPDDLPTYKTPKRRSRALSKLTAHRVSSK